MSSSETTSLRVGRRGLQSYVTGLLAALMLTIGAFWTIMSAALAPSLAVEVIVALALTQILAHLIFFLHLNTWSDQGWNLNALLFTVLIVGIVVGGSLWIMSHLNNNMMPMPMSMN
jgi:cytochrome o ubiquinol oxidase subunit IV